MIYLRMRELGKIGLLHSANMACSLPSWTRHSGSSWRSTWQTWDVLLRAFCSVSSFT